MIFTSGQAWRIWRDDPLELLQRPGRGVDVRGPQPGAEQVIAAEDVQRKIAVVLVVAVEEAAELMAVDRVVGGVEVEHDPLGGRLGTTLNSSSKSFLPIDSSISFRSSSVCGININYLVFHNIFHNPRRT